MLARVAVLVGCLAAVVVLVQHERRHDDCQSAAGVLFRFGVHAPPPPGAQVDAATRSLRASCADANALAVGAEGLRYGGRPAAAVALAAAATRSEPRTFVTWVAYGDALVAAGRPVQGGLAYEHAGRLNPRWRLPVLPVTTPGGAQARAGP